jgi:hypothetical protein
VQQDLKWNELCFKSVVAANGVLGMIKDHFVI